MYREKYQRHTILQTKTLSLLTNSPRSALILSVNGDYFTKFKKQMLNNYQTILVLKKNILKKNLNKISLVVLFYLLSDISLIFYFNNSSFKKLIKLHSLFVIILKNKFITSKKSLDL